MVDNYPSTPAAADHKLHLAIDAELLNCEQRTAAFEKAYPRDPSARMIALKERFLNRPRNEDLFPQLMAAKDRRSWLMPLLRRVAWNTDQGQAGVAWNVWLAQMVGLVLREIRTATVEEIVALADSAEPLLRTRQCVNFLGHVGMLAKELEKAGPLDDRMVDAVRAVLRLCDTPMAGDDSRSQYVWLLFRAENGFHPQDVRWCARVHRELFAMPPEVRARWMAVLAEAHALANSGALRSCLAAIKHLGNDVLEAGLRRWIHLLHEDAVLTADCIVIFRHVMALCGHFEGSRGDQLLYDIAQTPWKEQPAHRLMYQYLALLDRRSQDRAFACLEALMMHPLTATPEVRKKYDALLSVFGATAVSESSIGVDGYPLDSDPALVRQQTRIDQLLRMAASAAASGPYTDPGVIARLETIRNMNLDALPPAQRTALQMWESQMTRELPWFPVSPDVTAAHDAMQTAILREFSDGTNGLYDATVARRQWILAHQQEYPKDTLRLWKEWLEGMGCNGGLVRGAFSKVKELSADSLLEAIQADRGSEKMLGLCEEYVAKHGWSIELVTAFRKWIPKIGTASSDLMTRARAEWLVWFENVAPIQLDDCWSYRVKRDLRKMPEKEAAAWRELLENRTFIVTGKPPAKWMKPAPALFSKVGAVAFRKRFVAWFAPFGAGEPLRLTVTGRNILRILMWYALIAKDAAVDDALLGFARANWKTKEVAKRAAQAEMAFSYVVAQRSPETALPILEPLVTSGHAFLGSSTHKVYLELCERRNHKPVAAVKKQEKSPKAPAVNPLLANMTIGEFDALVRPPRRSTLGS